VLNLEDNKISRIDNLPTDSLMELNIKKNLIVSIHGVQNLGHLRRLVVSSNKISGFEHISDLLLSNSIVELSMDSNHICMDEYYRAILVNRIKSLKFLDGKRVSEDERRVAARIAKREAERRKASDRVSMLSEER
jgi:hypothetical protein